MTRGNWNIVVGTFYQGIGMFYLWSVGVPTDIIGIVMGACSLAVGIV